MAAVRVVQFGQTTDQAAGSRAPYLIFTERFKLADIRARRQQAQALCGIGLEA